VGHVKARRARRWIEGTPRAQRSFQGTAELPGHSKQCPYSFQSIMSAIVGVLLAAPSCLLHPLACCTLLSLCLGQPRTGFDANLAASAIASRKDAKIAKSDRRYAQGTASSAPTGPAPIPVVGVPLAAPFSFASFGIGSRKGARNAKGSFISNTCVVQVPGTWNRLLKSDAPVRKCRAPFSTVGCKCWLTEPLLA